MGLLFTLGLVAGSALLSGVALNRAALQSPELQAKIGGANASTLGVIGGTLGALLLPGLLGPIAAGLAIASALNRQVMAEFQQGLAARQLQEQLAAPMQAQIPGPVGPAAPVGPVAAAQRPGQRFMANLWDWLPGGAPGAQAA